MDEILLGRFQQFPKAQQERLTAIIGFECAKRLGGEYKGVIGKEKLDKASMEWLVDFWSSHIDR